MINNCAPHESSDDVTDYDWHQIVKDAGVKGNKEAIKMHALFFEPIRKDLRHRRMRSLIDRYNKSEPLDKRILKQVTYGKEVDSLVRSDVELYLKGNQNRISWQKMRSILLLHMTSSFNGCLLCLLKENGGDYSYGYIWASRSIVRWTFNGVRLYSAGGAEEALMSGVEEALMSGAEEALMSGAEEALMSGAEEALMSGAEEALMSGAEEALSDAEEAVSSAEEAVSDAEEALSGADEALSDAEEAVSSAEEAVSDAEEALSGVKVHTKFRSLRTRQKREKKRLASLRTGQKREKKRLASLRTGQQPFLRKTKQRLALRRQPVCEE
jgi:hypothetical protein